MSLAIVVALCVAARASADEFSAELEATTGDGSIDIDFPITMEGSRHRDSRVSGKMNGGGGLLELHTGDGTITIGRL